MNKTIIRNALLTSLTYVSIEAGAAEKLSVLLALQEVKDEGDEQWLPAAIKSAEERAAADKKWMDEQYPEG